MRGVCVILHYEEKLRQKHNVITETLTDIILVPYIAIGFLACLVNLEPSCIGGIKLVTRRVPALGHVCLLGTSIMGPLITPGAAAENKYLLNISR